jgi:hypothetical protein
MKMRDVIKFEVLNCKKVETALKRAEKQLIKDAKENGLYENIGQSYARVIRDEFLYSKGKDYQSQMEVVYAVQQFANRMTNLSMTELQYI